jgi:FkbM family methyltransferase
LSALYFNHVWPGCRIIAVEPAPDNLALLAENTRDNPNIRVVHAGIASMDGSLKIEDDTAETDAFRTVFGGGGDITAVSMPTLLREHDGEPFICKIDIEGAERELFSKNTDWIDLFPIIMIELHDWMLCGESASQSFLQAISRRRRDFIFYGDTVFSIRC